MAQITYSGIKQLYHNVVEPILDKQQIDMKDIKIVYELENSLGDNIIYSDETFNLLANVISELDCKLADNLMTIVDEVVLAYNDFLDDGNPPKALTFNVLYETVERRLMNN